MIIIPINQLASRAHSDCSSFEKYPEKDIEVQTIHGLRVAWLNLKNLFYIGNTFIQSHVRP